MPCDSTPRVGLSKEHFKNTQAAELVAVAQSLAELRAREEEVAREWEWLQDALNKVARTRAGEDEVHAFRLLQHQAVAVGQRRVELQMEMARLETERDSARTASN